MIPVPWRSRRVLAWVVIYRNGGAVSHVIASSQRNANDMVVASSVQAWAVQMWVSVDDVLSGEVRW